MLRRAGVKSKAEGRVSERDYSKFLNDEGRFDVTLLPRRVYTAIVNEYRRRPEVIDDVFEEFYFAWDLEDKTTKAEERGENPHKADIAQQVLDEMDDADWWRVMGAFEKRAIAALSESPEAWAEYLAPVYDEQETSGWRRLQ